LRPQQLVTHVLAQRFRLVSVEKAGDARPGRQRDASVKTGC
jgi:hypothetical protein